MGRRPRPFSGPLLPSQGPPRRPAPPHPVNRCPPPPLRPTAGGAPLLERHHRGGLHLVSSRPRFPSQIDSPPLLPTLDAAPPPHDPGSPDFCQIAASGRHGSRTPLSWQISDELRNGWAYLVGSGGYGPVEQLYLFFSK
jgi:hypothetical protein